MGYIIFPYTDMMCFHIHRRPIHSLSRPVLLLPISFHSPVSIPSVWVHASVCECKCVQAWVCIRVCMRACECIVSVCCANASVYTCVCMKACECMTAWVHCECECAHVQEWVCMCVCLRDSLSALWSVNVCLCVCACVSMSVRTNVFHQSCLQEPG